MTRKRLVRRPWRRVHRRKNRFVQGVSEFPGSMDAAAKVGDNDDIVDHLRSIRDLSDGSQCDIQLSRFPAEARSTLEVYKGGVLDVGGRDSCLFGWRTGLSRHS